MRNFATIALCLIACHSQAAGQADVPTPTPEQAAKSMQAAVDWLMKNQETDGAWGSHRNAAVGIDDFWTNPETHRSWRVATTALGCMTMLDLPRSESTMKAFDRGIDYIMENAMVKRISEWDVDNVWAYVYAASALARAYAIAPADQAARREKIHEVTLAVLKKMRETQTPSGGWGYYDFEAFAHPGAWATSFTTAVGVLGMLDAKKAGFQVDSKMLEAAVKAVKRCRLPNGAYTYSVDATPTTGRMEGINQVKGSLSRIQVCNLALLLAGEKVSADELRSGLDVFFKDHKFLDVARKKPIPHEAYYANSGYFYFFGHYYAALVISQLPEADQAKYWPQLQREIVKTQEEDGSMWDYPMNSYHRPYGTAFSVMALVPSIPKPDVKKDTGVSEPLRTE